MALVNVSNIVALDNPTNFTNQFQFEITFECLQELEDDLEWKVLYVGSAESSSYDQTLDEVMVGPIPIGLNKFVLQADAPDVASIPKGSLLGVTVVLVTCSYKEQEFVRIGYYVNNEYQYTQEEIQQHQQKLQQEQQQQPNSDNNSEQQQQQQMPPPPEPLDLSRVYRTILADKPRVTRFPIKWSSVDSTDEQAGENNNNNNTVDDAMATSPTKQVDDGMHSNSSPDNVMQMQME